MKIKITATLIGRRTGEVRGTYEHIYNSYEEALNYVLDTSNFQEELEMSYIHMEKEIINEED